MKTENLVSILAVTALALSARAADSKETVGSAIKALKEKANYSWSTTSELASGQFPARTTKGKTEKEGFTLLTTEGQNGEVQAVKKGEKQVLKTDEGWKTAEDLMQGGQGRGRGFFVGFQLLNASVPADDADELLKGVKELKAGDGGIYTGEWSEQAAKDRAGFFGRGRGGRGRQGGPGNFTPPEPKDAKGTVQFWVKKGALTKFQLTTSAKMTFQEQDMDIGRTATTEISNVGSTKVEVPEDAKKKL